MDRSCGWAAGAIRLVFLLQIILGAFAGAPDLPFAQPISHKYPLPVELQGEVKKICIDHDGIVYILTSKGVARLFDDRVALDRSYRPLAGKVATDITVSEGDLYYLFPDEVLSNRRAGRFVKKLDRGYSHLAMVNPEILAVSRENAVTIFYTSMPVEQPGGVVDQLATSGFNVFARSGEFVTKVFPNFAKLGPVQGLTTMALRDRTMLLGTTNGYYVVELGNELTLGGRIANLPSADIHSFAFSGDALWAATSGGIWRKAADGNFRYFASKRWLDDDQVVDIAIAPSGDVFALTQSGLNRIEFRMMTLAEKAMHYENKIRQRHIRYGFCAELNLKRPGDITSAEMIDTDNDGTWSNYYMASQAFRFGATGDPQARRNAWETFEALERLEEINSLGGFPSRTFERTGFKVSDPERWYGVGDGIWDWKAHTSSDEIAAHVFGSSVLYECAANNEEKKRIATFIDKVAGHIVRNKWYLIDKDGKPTLWARWNPEYVNWFPETIYDRRLNSAEITALLQFAFKITGKEIYRDKAFELFENHGYLENILIPMSRIKETLGYKHEGIEMGNEWNHSDDLLGFITYWVLNRYAFNDRLRAQFAAATRDHWEIERNERCPLWSFVCASTGASEFDFGGALWTLRGFPLDMTDWSISNSHRQDITKLPRNFRHQQVQELLPPDERRITRWNSQPFILDGGNGGRTELAGDEYLLPYWMGRYLKLIDAPSQR